MKKYDDMSRTDIHGTRSCTSYFIPMKGYITWCDLISIWNAFASHIIHHNPSQCILYFSFGEVIDRGCVHILHMHSYEMILVLKLASLSSQLSTKHRRQANLWRQCVLRGDILVRLVPCVLICFIAYGLNGPFEYDLQYYQNARARL